jgi:hypothetical protein
MIAFQGNQCLKQLNQKNKNAPPILGMSMNKLANSCDLPDGNGALLRFKQAFARLGVTGFT